MRTLLLRPKAEALSEFDKAAATYPRCHITLLEVRNLRHGSLRGYRLDVLQHLMPLQSERRTFVIPIRHKEPT